MIGSHPSWHPFSALARRAIWLGILGFGLAQAFSMRHYVPYGDPVSYFDVGDLWLAGNWREAINGYWNPLYPILLSGMARLLGLEIHEAIAAHVLSWLMLGPLLWLSERLLHELARIAETVRQEREARHIRPMLFVAGYILFPWTFCHMLHQRDVNPDYLVAACVLGASLLLSRIRNDGARPRDFAWLGVVLALGYWSKTIMFLLAPAFLLGSVCAAWPHRKGILLGAGAAGVYAALAAPLVIALSVQKGRFTYGESGRLAYAWAVNDVRGGWMHWQGGTDAGGTAKHPTRKLSDAPPVFEFRWHKGTYPPWTDPSYWNEGLQPRFDLRQQIEAINRTSKVYYSILFAEAPPLLAFFWFAGMAASCGGACRAKTREAARRVLPLAFAPGLGLLLYLLVHVEPRYVAPFIFVLMLATAAALLAGTALVANLRIAVACGLIAVAPMAASEAFWFLKANFWSRAKWTEHQRAALELRRLGLKPGDEIGLLGYGPEAFFARYARLKIVAEAPRPLGGTPVWLANPELEENAVKVLSALKVKAIVRDYPSNADSRVPWRRVGDTRFLVLFPPEAEKN